MIARTSKACTANMLKHIAKVKRPQSNARGTRSSFFVESNYRVKGSIWTP